MARSSERANHSSENHGGHEQSGRVCLVKNTQLKAPAYSNVIKAASVTCYSGMRLRKLDKTRSRCS